MYKKWWLGCFFLLAASTHAETISLEYKAFYDRLKQVNKGNYQLVEVAFSVPKQQNCLIENGTISNEKTSTPLTYTDAQRLFIPLDDDLKNERTLVNLNFAGSAAGCAIAMQVRAKQTLTQYDRHRLQQINTEMDALLGTMQGFPMRYFRDPIAGLNFEFSPDQPVVVYIDNREQEITGSFKLAASELDNITSLRFSVSPSVLSPWIQ
ncbi:DUF2987 domain-containing protein [Shewanella morhuae]|uniref:DUF2987 domain-containing protein n=1 Tax=Shewanella morhuae TaxID=365591 RepID=UPI001BC7A7C5|nr:DUF2987 domain-containing protein [Shewanella morhuae]GIU10335.1 hypothetical protein TUM4641_26930 [Shewanella morhuae]